MIYFIRDSGSGHIKIGVSVTPWKRLRYLQTGHASDLEMLAVIEGVEADERALHDRFRQEAVRGEWFRGDGLLAAFVLSLVRSGKNITAPVSAHGQLMRISRATGISKSYLCEIRKGNRAPASKLATIFLKTGVKFGPLVRVSDADAAVWARVALAMGETEATEAAA